MQAELDLSETLAADAGAFEHDWFYVDDPPEEKANSSKNMRPCSVRLIHLLLLPRLHCHQTLLLPTLPRMMQIALPLLLIDHQCHVPQLSLRLLLLLLPPLMLALQTQQGNPIRKVVTMLQLHEK